MCMNFLPASVSKPHVCLALGGQKRAMDFMKQVLLMFVNHPVGPVGPQEEQPALLTTEPSLQPDESVCTILQM